MSNKKNKKGCLSWLYKCFIDDETDEGVPQPSGEVILERSHQPQEQPYNSKLKLKTVDEKIKINTLIDRNIIHSNQAYDQDTKFNCPICLKYFSNILLLQCCKNQICIYCAEEYKQTQLKYDFHIKCPFCEYDKEMIMNDADIEEPNKIYSDSPNVKKYIKVEVRPSTSIINLQQ